MIKINVIVQNIKWKKYIKQPQAYINKNINLINKNDKELRKKNFICTILLSGPYQIQKLNKKFRKKNKPTDVLSFPFYDKKVLSYKIKNKQREVYLGDIIINFDSIKNKKNKDKFTFEFNKIWVHGLLHLFGHTHKKNQDFYVMNTIERKYVNILK